MSSLFLFLMVVQAIVAALLAHEACNARSDWSRWLTDCITNETFAAQESKDEWAWFAATFGPPVLTSQEAYITDWLFKTAPSVIAVRACGMAKM